MARNGRQEYPSRPGIVILNWSLLTDPEAENNRHTRSHVVKDFENQLPRVLLLRRPFEE